MNLKLIAVFVLCAMLTFNINAQNLPITQKRAYQLVKDKLTNGTDGTDFYIYGYIKKCTKSDSISLWNKKITSPYDASWLFFVDEAPLANWTHDCKYIFVNDKNTYEVISEVNPPKAYDNFNLLSKVEIPAGNKYDFTKYQKNKLSLLKSAKETPADYGVKYAVILSGGYNKDNNHERYWNDCSAIYSTLKLLYGFEDWQIFVLMADGLDSADDRKLISGGFDSSPGDLDGDGNAFDIHNMCNKQSVTSLFDMLGSWMKPEDFLFVFSTDHGSRESGNDVKLCLWNEQEMRDDEFATEINKINAEKISIVMEQCHSGGFIDDLQANNRVIATACRADQSSWATSDAVYNEFVFHWTAGALGQYPDGTVANADANGDQFVSMWEAFDYAQDNDLWAQPGQAHSEEPQYSSQTLVLGEQLTLHGFEVNRFLQNETVTNGDEQNIYAYNINAAGSGTNYVINSGATVNMKAGNSITLGPGFKAELGASFKAFIEPFAIPVLTTGTKKSLAVEKEAKTIHDNTTNALSTTDKDFKIYPNPSTGLFYLQKVDETKDKSQQIQVYDINGKLLLNEEIYGNRWIIDLRDQPSGTYFVKSTSVNNCVTQKMIKK